LVIVVSSKKAYGEGKQYRGNDFAFQKPLLAQGSQMTFHDPPWQYYSVHVYCMAACIRRAQEKQSGRPPDKLLPHNLETPADQIGIEPCLEVDGARRQFLFYCFYIH
jgi:hypothetical protein